MKVGACEKNRDLVLAMGIAGKPLNVIARRVGTSGRHVRRFLDRNKVIREYKKNYGGPNSPQWKGGRTVSRGYIRLWNPKHPDASNGYVLEHRLVMESLIGRRLLKNEVVHHRDGDKSNNSPYNLQLFSENKLHLAHELKGKVPKWTADGLVRMKVGIEKSASQKRGKTGEGWHWRWKLKHGVQPSQ